jgi:secreted trypsin-like serine protease
VFEEFESDEVLLIKVTCFSDYQLMGDVFHFCENGVWQRDFPICKRLPSGPIVRNSGLWKPDGRKGECGSSFSPRANVNEVVKTVEDYYNNYINYFTEIVAGNDANPGKYPWMALIGYDPLKKGGSDNFYLCGGSLINKHYVLTAAHCILSTFNNDTTNGPPVEVILGEQDFSKDEDCTPGDSRGLCSAPIIRREININRDVIVHEKYNVTGNRENDIALIRINDAVPLHQENEFESSISPICLPWNTNVDMETREDQIATVAGWGRTTRRKTENSLRNLLKNNILVKVLQELDLPIANEKCKTDPTTRTYISVFDPEIQICAGGEKGKDSCNGDSGGPLMVDKNNVAYQIGLVSFGTKTCALRDLGIPGVYTKVSKFLPWIAKNLKA